MSSDNSYRDPKTMAFDLPKNRVLVHVDGADEARSWLRKAEKGDFIVRLTQRLEEGAEVEVLLHGGVPEMPLRCKVKQVFRSGRDRHGTMLEWLEREGVQVTEADELEPKDGPEDNLPATAPRAEDDGSGPDSQWTEIPVQKTETAEPTPAEEVREEEDSDSSSGSIHLTRRIPDPAPEGAQMFDVNALNPEAEDGSSSAQATSAQATSARATSTQSEATGVSETGDQEGVHPSRVSVDVAERRAEELEALLSASGTWRKTTIDAALDQIQKTKARDEDAAHAEQGADDGTPEEVEETGSSQDSSTKNPGLTPEAQQAIMHNETRGASLAHTIGAMNPNEKARLAVRASRQERRLLLRDHTFSVQMGLLNNPRTENKEILEIAANPQTTGGILKRLASDRKWASNYEIQMALVKHPGTPSPLAIRLLGQLRISDLRVFAKSQALRENVRKAALRLYLQRSE